MHEEEVTKKANRPPVFSWYQTIRYRESAVADLIGVVLASETGYIFSLHFQNPKLPELSLLWARFTGERTPDTKKALSDLKRLRSRLISCGKLCFPGPDNKKMR
jgi:hypothetical protein